MGQEMQIIGNMHQYAYYFASIIFVYFKSGIRVYKGEKKLQYQLKYRDHVSILLSDKHYYSIQK